MQADIARDHGVSIGVVKSAIRAAGLMGRGGQPRNTVASAQAAERHAPESPPAATTSTPANDPQPPAAEPPQPPPSPPEPSIPRGRAPRPEYREAFAQLGPMKPDPVERVDWLHKALSISAQHIVADPHYPGDEVARRKELRDTARALAHCTPASLIAQVLTLIKADADELEGDRSGGEPEPDEDTEGDSFASRAITALPRRGRPRKIPT